MLLLESQFVGREACPSCRSVDGRTLYRIRLAQEPLRTYLRNYYRRDVPDGPFQLDECGQCGLVFHRFIGTDAFLAELYSSWIECSIDDVFRSDVEKPSTSRDGHELMALSAHLGKAKLKVLDYGAGWGLWPIIASRLGHQAYAVEIAPAKAQWMARHGVTVLADEDIARHRFDVINLEQTLEHLTHPREALESLVPSLDGILKLSVPNAAKAPRRIDEYKAGNFSNLPLMLPFEHLNAFNAWSLDALAAAVGLYEVRPSLRQRYSFLNGGLPHSPKQLAKELIRPLWTFRNATNLYRWYS